MKLLHWALAGMMALAAIPAHAGPAAPTPVVKPPPALRFKDAPTAHAVAPLLRPPRPRIVTPGVPNARLKNHYRFDRSLELRPYHGLRRFPRQ